MKPQLVVSYHPCPGYDNQCTVSLMSDLGDGMLTITPSVSHLIGTGNCFGEALTNCLTELNKYIADLTRYRDEVMMTEKAYTEAKTI